VRDKNESMVRGQKGASDEGHDHGSCPRTRDTVAHSVDCASGPADHGPRNDGDGTADFGPRTMDDGVQSPDLGRNDGERLARVHGQHG
jgi:hypothetical protein